MAGTERQREARTTQSTPPQAGEHDAYDGVELTDEDLQYVVGGLSAEASIAYARFIQEAMGRQ